MNTQTNKNQIKVSGGTTGQALVKLSNTNYDYDWGTVGGGATPSNPLDVTILDDFVSAEYEESGANSWATFGNFSSQRLNVIGFDSLFTEQNHPGIINLTNNDNNIKGFQYATDGMGTSIGINSLNDFSFTILTRLLYTQDVGNTYTSFYAIYGTGGESFELFFIQTTGVLTVEYSLNGGANVDVTGLTTFPASNTWFTVTFSMFSGVLTVSLNSDVLYSANPAFTTDIYPKIARGSLDVVAVGSAPSVNIDYVLTNYQVTR